jgi:hypothetical protein
MLKFLENIFFKEKKNICEEVYRIFVNLILFLAWKLQI